MCNLLVFILPVEMDVIVMGASLKMREKEMKFSQFKKKERKKRIVRPTT